MMLSAFRSYHSMPKWMQNCHPARHGLAAGVTKQVKTMQLWIACRRFLQGFAFVFV